jgi:hypothetical protein
MILLGAFFACAETAAVVKKKRTLKKIILLFIFVDLIGSWLGQKYAN